MLLRRRTDEGQWHEITERGEKIRLKIRPLTADVIEGIRKQHERTIKERDPQTRSLISKVVAGKDEDILLDIIDHILEDFSGFGDEDGKELDVTVDNKKWVMNIPAIDNNQSIADFVFEQARELAVMKSEKKEAAIKNL